MAQGSGKLAKAKKSKGAQKRQAVRKKTPGKGRKHYKAKRVHQNVQAEEDTTKAINQRNESIVAAKAVSSGTNFFMKNLSEKGNKEMNKQLRHRDKRQDKQKSSKLTDRLEDRLKKIES
mmetsp:Transcript_27033/g.63315  ORF Transcript_27033/g.63315 Transcript_27033/m.63315 type:complete len:119 (+) Transcript_27033:109-465(+)